MTKPIFLTPLLHFESNKHKLSIALGLGPDGVMMSCVLKFQHENFPRWTSQQTTKHDALAECHRLGHECEARPALTVTAPEATSALPLANLDQVTFLHTGRDVLSCQRVAITGSRPKGHIRIPPESVKKDSQLGDAPCALTRCPRCDRGHLQPFNRFPATCRARPKPDGPHSRHKCFWLDLRLQTLVSVLFHCCPLERLPWTPRLKWSWCPDKSLHLIYTAALFYSHRKQNEWNFISYVFCCCR